MQNLGIYEVAKDGLNDLGINIHELEEKESDAGLGNGGLGRLAACFMDSSASLSLPVHGNSIRYEYGFFKQKIENGRQLEVPDQWLTLGNVWEIRKPKHAVMLKHTMLVLEQCLESLMLNVLELFLMMFLLLVIIMVLLIL